MCKSDVVRAWKDEDYRMTLSEAERMILPANPAGPLEISDSQLGPLPEATVVLFRRESTRVLGSAIRNSSRYAADTGRPARVVTSSVQFCPLPTFRSSTRSSELQQLSF